MADWYYAKGNDKHGPVGTDELQQLAVSGQLLPSDLVWRKGTKEWRRAETVEGLFPDNGPTPDSQKATEAVPPPIHAKPQSMPAGAAEHSTIPPEASTQPSFPQGGATKISIPPALIVLSFVCCFPVGFVLIWIQSDWDRQKKIIWTAIAGVCVLSFCVCMGIISVLGRNMIAAQINEANELWDQGNQAEAVALYKDAVNVAPDGKKSTIYGRIIDFEASQGNEETVREIWNELEARVYPILPSCETDAAKEMIAKFEKEKAEAKRKEEAEKERKRQAEERMRAIEASKGKKLNAFKKVVRKYKETPDDLSSSEERRKFNEELRTVQEEFFDVPFEPTLQRDEARQIVRMFEAEIDGLYKGRLYLELRSELVDIRMKLIE